MASSRWKRFAFFDRKNLSLPPPVVKDLIPSKSTSTARGGSSGGNNDNNLDPKYLYQNDDEPTIEDCVKIGHGEYFSLVAAENVSLPSSLLSTAVGIGDDGVEAVATKRGVGGDGASGMQAGLVALHSTSHDPTNAHGNSSSQQAITKGSSNTMTISAEGGGDGELLLLFASSRNTSLVHCIDVTVRCTPSNPRLSQQTTSTAAATSITAAAADASSASAGMDTTNYEGHNAFAPSSSNQTNSNNSSNNSLANPEELDGWRGHYNPFSSCDGFISGKRDVNLLGGTTSVTKPPKPPSSTSTGRGRKSTAQQRILDEHLVDDYDNATTSGGSLFGASPFANDLLSEKTQQQPPSSSSSAPKKARIVGLATCSSTFKTSAKSSSSILYVASITDTPDTIGVVVHANPHLMLSSLPPSSASSNTTSKTNMYSSYYKPSTMGAFHYATHGKPRCVSILPGVVCIGTDTGAVLIYVFKANDSVTPSSSGRLTLVAEIPAPRAASSGNEDVNSKNEYAVSSVELVGPSLDKNANNASSLSNSNNSNGNNNGSNIHRLFVSYRRRVQPSSSTSPGGPNTTTDLKSPPTTTTTTATSASSSSGPSGGVCCYDLGGLRIPGRPLPLGPNAPVVSARYDMDGRDVGTSCLCDGVSLPPVPPSALWMTNESKPGDANVGGGKNGEAAATSNNGMEKMLPRFAVARSDGLHLYSPEEKVGVCPIDGNKICICALPPPPVVYLRRPVRPPASSSENGMGGGGASLERNNDGTVNGAGASYALVATTDSKSGRDAVDIYDTTNKLVGFHVLLSPGHRALRTVGIVSSPTVGSGTLLRGGRSSAIVFTSGGSIVTLTERVTPDKVDLLTQKNLYAAAISMAFSDPQFYRPEDITALYRRYAEHLYRKGDFGAAMDQYILTIGSLESSHVIFRYLDAPKIGLAVRYLEALRVAGLSSSVHDELLRTCYLKLGDVDAASKIILTSKSSLVDGPALNPDGSEVATVPISRNLLACADDPSEMLAAICSLDASEAAEALVAHGVLIARSLPRETAGVVIALCDGSYSPTAMADAAAGRQTATIPKKCERYPISLFANAFMENPKLFRLILSHCRRNDCVLTPMLRRTLLELTLDEWNSAKRTGDVQVQKLRHDEAIIMLSENHVDDMGDYEALVIVQAAGFAAGEILLYERLNMVPMLLEEYAKSGTDRARRQMLAMCEHQDPEIFAEVLSHFVNMARERLDGGTLREEASVDSESDIGGLLHDIHEALVMARDHGDLPPVRILRILAGEGHGMFNSDKHASNPSLNRCGVPLSAAMDYVGAILDDYDNRFHRLKSNVEEYSRMCNDIELEINSLLPPRSPEKNSEVAKKNILPNVDIDEMYSNLCQLGEDGVTGQSTPAERGEELGRLEMMKEDFWREMEHSDDPFETICFYMSKGYLENI